MTHQAFCLALLFAAVAVMVFAGSVLNVLGNQAALEYGGVGLLVGSMIMLLMCLPDLRD